jgi:hypothetical protein
VRAAIARDTLNAALATVRLGAACEETAPLPYQPSRSVICSGRHRQGSAMHLAVTRLGAASGELTALGSLASPSKLAHWQAVPADYGA